MVHTEERSSRSRRVEMVFGSIVLLVYVPLFIRVLSASSPDPGGGVTTTTENTTMVVNVTRVGASSATLTWGPNVTGVTYRLSVQYRHWQDEQWELVRDLRFTDKTSHVLQNLEVHSGYRVCIWRDFADRYGNFTGRRSDRKVCREFVTKHVLTRDGILAIIVATILGCMILVMIGTCVVDFYFYTIKGHDREDDIVMVKASLIPYIDKKRCPCQDKAELQRKQSQKQKKPKPSGMYGLARGSTIKR